MNFGAQFSTFPLAGRKNGDYHQLKIDRKVEAAGLSGSHGGSNTPTRV
jgi:hypothetical protein